MGDACNCPVVGNCGRRTDFFLSCGHYWGFQICWHIECNTLIALTFRILNSSAGISFPPLALLTAVLPKNHLTSQSRISGSGWVSIVVIWIIKIFFLHSSSIYYFHLFLISSASLRLLSFLSFIVSTFGWNAPLIFPVFSKRSFVFPLLCFLLFLCIVYWRRPSCLSLLFSGLCILLAVPFPIFLAFYFSSFFSCL